MLPRLRRTFYAKFLVFGTIILCFLLYLKVVNKNLENTMENYSNDNSISSSNNNNIINNNNNNNINNAHSISNTIIDALQQDKESIMDINPLEKMIKADLDKQVPGLGDKGVSVTLDGESKVIGEKNIEKLALNEELSKHLSYNRTTPDARNPLCKAKKYDLKTLPTASVVIIFFNEPYSVLLRTVHSVLNTADKSILKEIILVDDGSDTEELHDKLDYYIKTRLPIDVVKIIRLKHRLGLIRARLAGARLARSDVLVFLDAHCECVVNWLEPLLERIQESRTSVLVPIIDVIDAKDFQYSSNGYKQFQVGGFTWNGHFDWIDIPKSERERQKRECSTEPEICPTYSPTMAGGLFAISRDYFWEIGSYDEQMDGWGGENLEMSFRIWQCGGTIETIPCSRVGHIFRDFHPYSFPNDRDTHGINTVRMALVWMDEYIDLFFMNRPDLKNIDVGDVTHRKILRKKLKCKNFDWYLKHIYPQKFIPTKDMRGYGRIMATSRNLCLDDLQQNNEEPYNLGVYFCHKPSVTKSQFFSLTLTGVLRNELSCATVQKSDSPPYLVVMAPCHNKDKYNEKWEYTNDGKFIHLETGMCLDHRGLQSSDFVQVSECINFSGTQKWSIEH